MMLRLIRLISHLRQAAPCRRSLDYGLPPRRYQPPLHCRIGCLLQDYKIIQNYVSKIMD
ncbi:hypothetical protein HanRHA438_Chr15g0700981 [Helianthus annuus]|nr:hypothetical protein HanRHA438_Chr15g0700981 [Helianthus annuus]